MWPLPRAMYPTGPLTAGSTAPLPPPPAPATLLDQETVQLLSQLENGDLEQAIAALRQLSAATASARSQFVVTDYPGMRLCASCSRSCDASKDVMFARGVQVSSMRCVASCPILARRCTL